MTIATLAMESIDEPRLESDTDYRVGYLTKFMGFGPDDVQAIHDSAAHLAPLVPSLVDAVYLKLFAFDATKPDGTPRKLLDTSLINGLGWLPRIEFEAGLRSTYQWFTSQGGGFRQ